MIRPLVPLVLAAVTLAGCGPMAGMFPADRGPATPAATAPVADTIDIESSGTPEGLAQEYVDSLYRRGNETDSDGLVSFVSARVDGTSVIAEYETEISRAEMTDDQLAEIGPQLSSALRANLCSQGRARVVLERGVAISLVLLDSSGQTISNVTVEDC